MPEHALVAAADPDEQISAFIRNHTVPLLSQAVRGNEAGRPDWSSLEGAEYLVALFIRHLVDHDNVAFGYLVEAVKGAILAAVLDFKAPDLRQSLDKLTIMLDTPVILKALGYHGATQREAVRQTLTLARALKVKIACFDHTTKEIGNWSGHLVPLRAASARSVTAAVVRDRGLGAGQADDCGVVRLPRS